MKRCIDCLEDLPSSSFYQRKTGQHYTRCKTCYNEDKKKRDRNRNRKTVLTAICIDCREEKSSSDFHKNRSTANGLAGMCKLCAYKKNARFKYGIEDIDIMVKSRGGKCDICREDFNRSPNVDHDHSCCPGDYTCGNCVRGLLCARCNHGLGHFRDNPAYLRRAANYLDS